jgi:DNA-binding winged helix-turn-helix (wHTH) protein
MILDVIASTLTHDGATVWLTPIEFRIVEAVSRFRSLAMAADLVRIVWANSADEPENPTRSLSVAICHIRAKIKRLGIPDLIRTHYGAGYSFIIPVDVQRNHPAITFSAEQRGQLVKLLLSHPDQDAADQLLELVG